MGRRRILSLEDSNGTKSLIILFLKSQLLITFKIFTLIMSLRPFTTNVSFPMMFDNAGETLSRYPNENEIKQALFSMNRAKAHGPDGYIALFYQNQWSNVKDSLISFITNCFNNLALIDTVNGVLISFIPEATISENITQFRPIRLCNVNYKILTKIPVQRIQPFMSNLIGQEQAIFAMGGKSRIIL